MTVMGNFTVSITRTLSSVKKSKELVGSRIPSILARRSISGTKDGMRHLKMDKFLIVSKVTRYEFEKQNAQVSDCELEQILRQRGSDYDTIMSTHRTQKQFECHVAYELKKAGARVKMANRSTYNADLINWCDVVLPCGGDGTFLLAASRVCDVNKPVIGFNSAPDKSVGRLCLPTWCSYDVSGALKALREGKFIWMRRTRIRTIITCDPNIVKSMKPQDLHSCSNCNKNPTVPANRHEDDPSPSPQQLKSIQCSSEHKHLPKKVLPFLALNEVFVGESVTSRVSMLRVKIDDGIWTPTKSSGFCVTTGTGSTSWHFSINCLRTHSVQEIMKVLAEMGAQLDTSLEKAREVTERYNQKLMFPPDDQRLAYSVREFIMFEDWPTPRGLRVRNFANSVKIKSHCIDAGLVIDGGVSFPFNDGTEATLEVHPEDALMTVQMDDSPV